MRKGITPIISIVILLLIAVGIAGAGYTWITSYYTGLTGDAIAVTDTTCSLTGVTIYIQNIGTEELLTSAMTVQRDEIGANATMGAIAMVFDPTTVNPGQITTATDEFCNKTTSSGGTCIYRLITGGRVTTTQVTC